MASGARGAQNAGGSSSRLPILLLIFAAITAIFVGRLVYLQVIVADEYSEQAAASRTVVADLSPRRGTIYDRNGKVLATSVDATTIYVNPKEVEDASATANALSEVLGGEASDYRELIDQDTTFVYVKRKADVEVADTLREKGLAGVHFLEDTKRVYPYGQVGGQVLGFVNIDGEGVCGLELYYDDILRGSSGKLVVQQGAYGIPIPGGTEVEEPATDGQDIIVSIDIDMQEYLENRLAQGVEDIGGEDGSAVLMDASTGELLAIASTPYFNPADTSVVEDGATSIKAITTQFEPGSIFKAVSAMAMLEAGAITPETVIDCPVQIQADEYTISDAHERPATSMTMRQVIAESSNVGTALAVESYLGFRPLYDKILSYGLNEATGVDYPGEATGYLTNVDTWPQIQRYNVTFGQGVSVSPLQMVRFYGALANGGVACTPHFLTDKLSGEEVSWPTEQIIQNVDAIPDMTEMLEAVVTEGTGTSAAIDGYTVAGKTGTAEYADETGAYAKGMYNLDFVGYLPDASTPLVCFVGVNHVPYERNTTEVFRDIMTEAISRYRVVQS